MKFLLFLSALPVAAWGGAVEELYGERAVFERVVRDGKGRVRAGVLEKEVTVAHADLSVRLAAGQEFTLHANGRLKRATAGSEMDLKLFLGVLPIAAGSRLEFQEDGALDLRRCAFDLRQDADLTLGSRSIPLKKTSRLFFLDNGSLDFARSEVLLARYHALKFKNMTLKGKVESELGFYENGAVQSLSLGENIALPVRGGAIAVGEASRLFLREDEELDYERCVFIPRENAPLLVRGESFLFAKGEPLLFQPEGGVREGRLAQEATLALDGMTLAVKPGTKARFDPMGLVDPRDGEYLLAADARIRVGETDLVLKKETTLRFFPTGSPAEGTLAEGLEIVVQGTRIPLPKGASVFFLDTGDVDVLRTPLVLDRPTLMTVAGSRLPLAAGVRLYLTTEGELDVLKTRIQLAEPSIFVFRGRPLPLAAGPSLQFHPKGVMRSATIGRPLALTLGGNSIEFPAGTSLNFTDEGVLTSARLGEATRVRDNGFDLAFQKNSEMAFNEEGRLVRAVLAPGNVASMGAHRVPLPGGMAVDFSREGAPILLSVTLGEDAPFVIRGREVVFNKGDTLVFNSRKELDLIESRLSIGQKGTVPLGPNLWKVAKGSQVAFHKTGEVRSLVLAEPQEMKLGAMRIPLAAPRPVFFRTDGTVDPVESEIVLGQDMQLQLGPNKLPLAAGSRLYFQANDILDFTRMTLTLGKDSTIRAGKHDLPLVKGTVLEYHQDGNLDLQRTAFVLSKKLKKTLAGTAYVFGGGGAVTFHRGGEISRGPVLDEVKVTWDNNEFIFKGARDYYFKQDGSLDPTLTTLDLAQDRNVRVGAFTIPFKQGQTLRFHPSGRLRSGLILEDVSLSLGQTPIRMKKENVLHFTEEGFLDTQLTQVIVQEPISLKAGRNTIPVLGGTRIYFHNTGELWQAILGQEIELQVFDHRIPFKKGKRLYFFVNGEIDCDRTEVYLLAEQSFPVGNRRVLFQARKRLRLGPKGEVTRGWVAGAEAMGVGPGTFPLEAGSPVSFHPNGSVAGMTLREDAVSSPAGQKVTFGKGTEILFHPGGTVQGGELKGDTPIVVGGRGLVLKGFTRASFQPNGSLREGWLKEAASLRVGEKSVRLDDGFPVEFHDNGALAHGRLREAAKLQVLETTVVLKAGSEVRFHRNARLAQGTLEESSVFSLREGTMEVNAGSVVTFHESGRLREGYSRFPWRVMVRGSEVVLDPRAMIAFFDTGAVREGVLLKGAEGQGGTEKVLLAEGTRVRFHPDGRVAAGFPAASVRVPTVVFAGRAIACAPLRELAWDEAGRLSYANAGETLVYRSPDKESFTIHPGEWVYFAYPDSGPPEAYPIDLQGKLRRDTPFRVGNRRLVLPQGSMVALKGDDTLFSVISPSAPILFKGQVLVPRRAEIARSDLEERLKAVGGNP